MVLAVVVPAITPLYMFFSLFKVNARFGFNDAMFLKLSAALIRRVISNLDAKSCAIVAETFLFLCPVAR